MRLCNFVVFTVIVLVFGMVVIGCGNTPEIDVSQTLSSASEKLANGDMDGAKADYDAALSADSTNAEANFGAAMLGILGVAVDKNTSNLVSKFGYAMPTTLNGLFNATPTSSAVSVLNVSSFIQGVATPEITPSEVQTYIKDTLLSALDTALARLAIVESDPNFKYILTAKMTNSDKDRELDLGEVYALDVLGSLLKGILHESVSYNWDYTTSNPLSEEAFGVLKSDGAANMEAARTSYIRMMTKWIDGINYISAEADDQADDLIPQFPPAQGGVWLDNLGKVQNSLDKGATTIEVTATKSLVVNLKAYYSSPILDLKVYINGAKNNYPEGFNFTINGLFPEMETREDWENLASL